LAIKELYSTKQVSELDYKMPRKEAFLAISDLNAAFQRMTQDPKSKQREMALIYEIVTLNNAFLSALASLGSFIRNHKTTEASVHFNAFIQDITYNMGHAEAQLNGERPLLAMEPLDMENAQKNLENSYEQLASERTRQIEEGKVEIAPEMRLRLQEALLVSNELIWLRTLSRDISKAITKFAPR
jgi:uncharacterized membrane protein YccC